MKTFLGIDLSTEVREQILALQDNVKHLAPLAKWQQCPHMTLVFVGEKEVDHEAIQNVCDKHVSFECSTNGFGTFSRGVVWLAVDKGMSAVHRLGTELHEALGVKTYGKSFSPHLTMYKEGPTPPLELKQKLVRTAYGPWTVDHVTLFESLGGGNYKPIKEYPLNAS